MSDSPLLGNKISTAGQPDRTSDKTHLRSAFDMHKTLMSFPDGLVHFWMAFRSKFFNDLTANSNRQTGLKYLKFVQTLLI